VVARHLGLFRWNRSHRRTALGLHYEGVLPVNGFAEVFLGAGLYGILNPLGAGVANLSLVVDHDASLSKGHAGAYFAEALGRLPALRERLAQARPLEDVKVLGPMAHHAARASADGALLAGDAAGFYDPFTGEGVYMALISARLAAAVAGEALRRGDCSARFLRSYDRERSAALGGRYRLEAAIQRIIRHPRTADLVSRRLREREDAASRLMEVLGGLAWPRALLSGRFLAAFL
jgi:flavin-dependent dehydrogenase